MFQGIKHESPTFQLFFMFGLVAFGFLVYMFLQSIIVVNAFPGIEEMSEDEIMSTVMSSKNGAAQLLLILQQCLFFLIPGIIINRILKQNGKGIYMMNHDWKAYFQPILLMILAIFSLYFLLNANHWIIDLFPNSDYFVALDQERTSVVTQATDNDSAYLFILNLLGIAVLPAIGEELVFRGFLIRNFFQNSNNIYFAVFGSSILFALIHFQPLKFLPMFLIGLMLALFYVTTKNILVPIICHFINNVLSLISMKYNILEYTEYMWLSILATAFIVFRIVLYVRALKAVKVE